MQEEKHPEPQGPIEITTVKNENAESQPKSTNKDLLRLEKDCFEGVFHPVKAETTKQFAIKKMLSAEDRKAILPKPNFRELPKSDLLQRLQNFLPNFKDDTELLNNDPARKMKSNIEIDSPDVDSGDENACRKTKDEKKKVEMNLYMGVFDVKEKGEMIDEKNIIIPTKKT